MWQQTWSRRKPSQCCACIAVRLLLLPHCKAELQLGAQGSEPEPSELSYTAASRARLRSRFASGRPSLVDASLYCHMERCDGNSVFHLG
jgi:hypothetical protein